MKLLLHNFIKLHFLTDYLEHKMSSSVLNGENLDTIKIQIAHKVSLPLDCKLISYDMGNNIFEVLFFSISKSNISVMSDNYIVM